MTMFFMFVDISKLTCLELYITTANPPTQTCVHPPPIYDNSFEYIAQAMNLESSFEESPPPIYLIIILLLNDL